MISKRKLFGWMGALAACVGVGVTPAIARDEGWQEGEWDFCYLAIDHASGHRRWHHIFCTGPNKSAADYVEVCRYFIGISERRGREVTKIMMPTRVFCSLDEYGVVSWRLVNNSLFENGEYCPRIRWIFLDKEIVFAD